MPKTGQDIVHYSKEIIGSLVLLNQMNAGQSRAESGYDAHRPAGLDTDGGLTDMDEITDFSTYSANPFYKSKRSTSERSTQPKIKSFPKKPSMDYTEMGGYHIICGAECNHL